MEIAQVKSLPEPVLKNIFHHLRLINPALVLRFSSPCYQEVIPSLYESIEITDRTVDSILYGAIRQPHPLGKESTEAVCGIHPHEVNIDWYSRKVQALTNVKKLSFVDVEGMIRFIRTLNDTENFPHSSMGPKPKRYRRLFPNLEFLKMSRECVKAVSNTKSKENVRNNESRVEDFPCEIIEIDDVEDGEQTITHVSRRSTLAEHERDREADRNMLFKFEWTINPHIEPRYICLDYRFDHDGSRQFHSYLDLELNMAEEGVETIHTHFGTSKKIKCNFGKKRIINLPSPSLNKSRRTGKITKQSSNPLGVGDIDLDKLLEKEAEIVVETFKSSTCPLLEEAQLWRSQSQIKIEYCVPYASECINLVDGKMKLDFVEEDANEEYSDYFENWRKYIEIVDLEDTEVCQVCGKL
ncbi:hypothetical protein L486_08511 [Kwoniella mangroviensis CBS 10435]|uniref:F-box domain-containing protein n=1 Tax=Kwoniella mangroviensis CBS 10435 TaxID=1331196 RepID=A0A1B9IEZ7_9TREE|nr:hypothetical protein L486_08511 [Kwoniella mangroviensis CBS 10435]